MNDQGLQQEIDRLNALAAAAGVIYDEEGCPLPTMPTFHPTFPPESDEELELT